MYDIREDEETFNHRCPLSIFFCSSAKSTATTMAFEEKSEYFHGGDSSSLQPSSGGPQRSHKLHSGTLAARLQRSGGRCHCLGGCHKVLKT